MGLLKVGFFFSLQHCLILPSEGGSGRGFETVILLAASPVPFCVVGNPRLYQDLLAGVLVGSVVSACLVTSWIQLGTCSLSACCESFVYFFVFNLTHTHAK